MFRTPRSIGVAAAAVLVASLALGPSFAPSTAEGQGANRAQIYVVQGRVPSTFSGKDGLIRFGRQNHRNVLQEVTDVPVKERSWIARLIVQFTRPLGDWEFGVYFFQVNGNTREFINSTSVHVNDRNERNFIQKLELKRPEFKPNTKIDLVLRVRGHEAGTRRVTLSGEEIRVRHTGTVDFTQ
ncbi:MAG: hypothetical protein GXY23_04225 [Myxococcales bacterium]|jgi:hypothetical protein|nr:hypothetical protein [Myxococcales bacterium]